MLRKYVEGFSLCIVRHNLKMENPPRCVGVSITRNFDSLIKLDLRLGVIAKSSQLSLLKVD